MCRYCHTEGNNPYAVDHLTADCQDSRNPYNIKESKPQNYEGRVTQILKHQFKAQEQRAMMPQPMIGMGLTPYGPVAFGPVLIGPPLVVPPPTGFVPVMMSPGNVTFMPVFR